MVDLKMVDVFENNFTEGARMDMDLPSRVYVYDETIREGEETPGVTMTIKDKVNIATKLEEAGIYEIAAGFVAYNPAAAEACKEVHKACPKLRLDGAIRCDGENLERDLEFGKSLPLSTLNLYCPGSDYFFKPRGISKYYYVDKMYHAIALAKKIGFTDVTIGAYDTTRMDLEWSKLFFKAGLEAGANRIRVLDTLGVLHPSATRWWIKEIKRTFPVPIQYHCHNDFGNAVMNACAAVEAGAEYVDLVVNGLGDRAGNTNFEETVMALECLYRVNTGIKLEKIMELSKLVEKITKIPIPKVKAIVGDNVFVHESDIHVAAILSGRANTFEPYHPELVGQTRQIWFGSTTSPNSIKILAENRKLKLDESRINEISDRINKEIEKRVMPLMLR